MRINDHPVQAFIQNSKIGGEGVRENKGGIKNLRAKREFFFTQSHRRCKFVFTIPTGDVTFLNLHQHGRRQK